MDFDDGEITISEEYPSFEGDEDDEKEEESLDNLDITAIYLGDAFNDAVLEEQFNESDLMDDSQDDTLVAKFNRSLSRSLSDQENSSSGNSESDTTLVAEEEDCLEHTLICTPVIQSKKFAVVSHDSGRGVKIFSRTLNDSKSDQENIGMRKGRRIRTLGKQGLTSTPLRQIRASDVIVSCEEHKGDEIYSEEQVLITD